MKVTEITWNDSVKINDKSWTVKAENGKTKGVITGISALMKMPVCKISEVTKTLKQYGCENYRGNIFVDAHGKLYYPHDISENQFYDRQIKAFDKSLIESEYNRHLEYENVVNSIRKTEITVIDCILI